VVIDAAIRHERAYLRAHCFDFEASDEGRQVERMRTNISDTACGSTF
jgi:hypothetical protein